MIKVLYFCHIFLYVLNFQLPHDLKHLVPGEQFPDVPHGPPQTSFSAFRKIIKFWKKRNISTLYFGTYFAATTSIFGVISRLAAYWWLERKMKSLTLDKTITQTFPHISSAFSHGKQERACTWLNLFRYLK